MTKINKYVTEQIFEDLKASITPVKGVDYNTTEDKEELVQMVLEAIPAAENNSF